MERPDGCLLFSTLLIAYSERAAFLTPGVPTTEEVGKLLQRKEQIETQLANLEKCVEPVAGALLTD